MQDILHVFLALNRIVEEVEEQSQAQGHGESADDTAHKDQGFIGAHWLERREGWILNLHVLQEIFGSNIEVLRLGQDGLVEALDPLELLLHDVITNLRLIEGEHPLHRLRVFSKGLDLSTLLQLGHLKNTLKGSLGFIAQLLGIGLQLGRRLDDPRMPLTVFGSETGQLGAVLVDLFAQIGHLLILGQRTKVDDVFSSSHPLLGLLGNLLGDVSRRTQGFITDLEVAHRGRIDVLGIFQGNHPFVLAVLLELTLESLQFGLLACGFLFQDFESLKCLVLLVVQVLLQENLEDRIRDPLGLFTLGMRHLNLHQPT